MSVDLKNRASFGLRVAADLTGILARLLIAMAFPAMTSTGLGAELPEPVDLEAARARRAFGALTPEISPAGDAIAFSFQGAIWRMPREGGIMRRLTSGMGFDHYPSWSPDGRRLAYVSNSTGEVRIIDATTGRESRTIPGVLATGKVFFQRDGKHLLVGFRGPDPRRLIFGSVEVESGKIVPLAFPSTPVGCYAPSADGSQIVFSTNLDVVGEQWGAFGPQMDLQVVPARGGRPRKFAQFTGRIIHLWWGATEIVFSSDVGGAHYDLWALSPADPVRPRKLTFGQADEDCPSVSADGRWLVYTDNRESATSLIVRDLRTGEEKPAVPSGLDFGVPTGVLSLKVAEKATGQPLVARLSIQQQGGKYFAPLGALYRNARGVEHFYCREATEVLVPAGRYVIRGFRGPEYREAQQAVEVPAGGTVPVRVELDRWTDPSARSLWSGESHIHANYGYGEWYCTPEAVRLQVEGEGLNVANLVVANSHGDGVFDREFFRGSPDPESGPTTVLYWNEEFRSTLWGHMTFLGLKFLVEPIFTGFPATTNPWDFPTNAEVADHVHLQDGVVIYTHPGGANNAFLSAYTAKALPVDVALGKIDALDIDRFESVALWYALLNCGFRLGASAGTDVFLNKYRGLLPGHVRAYAKIDGPFSYEAWAESVRKGRTFVTNGPMLELTAAGVSSGDTIHLPATGEIPVHGVATWQLPLARAELVHNGDVIATATLSPDRHSATLNQNVRITKSGWLSFRAYNADSGAQAHSGVVYVDVAGKPAASRKDAEHFLQWIDTLEAKLRERDRVPSAALKAQVQSNLDRARAVYREIAARGD